MPKTTHHADTLAPIDMLRLAGALMLCSLLVLLAGCGGSAKKPDEPAPEPVEIEDRSQVPPPTTGTDETYGVDSGSGFQGNPLDDPSSPLSTRVIYFDYDSSVIRSEYRPVVEAHARYLASFPDTLVTLEGHADERGSREYNLALGERRANAVRRQLVLLGASAGQIRVTSYGEERPVAEGHDESAYSLNRRVEVLY